MKVVLFGATGMIGSAALIEALAHPDVEQVLAVGRRSCGVSDVKLKEQLHQDFTDYAEVAPVWTGYDACFFCLGVSAAGMSEEAYTRVTYDFAMAAAESFLAANPGGTFCYISGEGADPTGTSRMMWARVRGRLENDLHALSVGSVWVVRPGVVHPRKGVRSATRLYDVAYTVLGPIMPLLQRTFPDRVTASDRVGLTLIRLAREGAPVKTLRNADINEVANAESESLRLRS